MHQLFIVSGIVLTNSFTFIVSNDDQPGAPITPGWRYIFAGIIVITVIQATLLLTLYRNETPKYLMLQGRDEEAKDLIEELYLLQYS